MAKSKEILVGALALVGGVSLAKQGIDIATAKMVNNVSYVVGKPIVSIDNIGFGNVDIRIPVTLLNTNYIPISIDRFIGNVRYGNVPLGLVKINDKFTLEPDEPIMINLDFTANIQSTVAGVFSSAQVGLSTLLEKIYLDGNIYILGGSLIGQIALPISESIDILP